MKNLILIFGLIFLYILNVIMLFVSVGLKIRFVKNLCYVIKIKKSLILFKIEKVKKKSFVVW